MFAGRLDGTGAQWSAPINPQDLISLMIGTKADVSTVVFPFALITVSIRTSILGYHLMSIFQIYFRPPFFFICYLFPRVIPPTLFRYLHCIGAHVA